MIINIHGTGIDLTNAIKDYAVTKVEALQKFFDNIIKADIDVGMRNHHHLKGKIFYAEVTMSVPRRTIRVVKEAEDLYKAIDKVKDHLKQELDNMKEKMRSRDKEKIRSQKEYQM